MKLPDKPREKVMYYHQVNGITPTVVKPPKEEKVMDGKMKWDKQSGFVPAYDSAIMTNGDRIIYTCPKCGENLVNYVITTFPPINVMECRRCGWRHENERESVKYIPFPLKEGE